MDSLKFCFKKSDKANPSLKSHRSTRKIAALFRFLELFIFCIVFSRFSTEFYFFSGEYLKGISETLTRPGFAFLVINAILIVLLWISGQFSPGKGEKTPDFYEEYVEKCRDNRRDFREEEKRALVYQPKKVMRRSHSENLERAAPGKDMRRCMSEKSRRSERKAAADDEMSGDEFRRTVEAFIARQQRILMEEDEEVET